VHFCAKCFAGLHVIVHQGGQDFSLPLSLMPVRYFFIVRFQYKKPVLSRF